MSKTMSSSSPSNPNSNSIKENNGDLNFQNSSSSSSSDRRKKSRSSRHHDDSTGKLLIALLGGAGAAFLLAILVLASRLEADPSSSNWAADQMMMEEVAQGHASPALMLTQRRTKLADGIERLKRSYRSRLDSFKRLAGSDVAAMDRLVQDGVQGLDAVEGALNGDGALPDRPHLKRDFVDALNESPGGVRHESMAERFELKQPHLDPRLPPLPPHLMAEDLFGPGIVRDTLAGEPTLAGIVAILQSFLASVHAMEVRNRDATAHTVIDAYFAIVDQILRPFEEAYRHRPIFPIREDESIFMSLGAYRDHLLGETLRQAFKNAKRPERLFVGAVVQ